MSSKKRFSDRGKTEKSWDKKAVSTISAGNVELSRPIGGVLASRPYSAAVVFSILSASYAVAAYNAPVLDCDETFNYWEPLHYLTHGYGLQTWEYSPEFSIRSWAYILLHAVPLKLVGLFTASKVAQFYGLRFILALATTTANSKLYLTIARVYTAGVANWFLLVVAFMPGYFFASTAFLPSSFAMITGAIGLANFLDDRVSTGIVWFGIGAMIGWPFAGALVIPLFLIYLLHDLTDGSHVPLQVRVRKYAVGIVKCLLVLFVQVTVDSAFYRKLVVVPWRIVMYNVFTGGERGPDIFGTEPWHFYVRNLLLNGHVYFVLAMAATPLVFLRRILGSRRGGRALPLYATLAPFYLWFGIFTIQPHKEERFMFPAYPFLAFNAAVGINILCEGLQNLVPRRLNSFIVSQFAWVCVALSILRIYGILTAYEAPLNIYAALNDMQITPNTTICLGKDWYRFHSSFLLPDGAKAKFIKSRFDGLLPGEFAEGLGYAGTWTVPSGMNDQNIEDPDKYTTLSKCSFLIDSMFPSTKTSQIEPNFAQDYGFEPIKCIKFLDTASTSLLQRTIWVPDTQRVWGQHCLLRAQQPKRRLPSKAFDKRRVRKPNAQ